MKKELPTDPNYKGAKGNVYKIDLKTYPEKIRTVDGFNQRVEFGDMDWLIDSLRSEGMKVPAQGYYKDGNWFLTTGHRRLKAAQQIVAEGNDFTFLIMAEPQGHSMRDRLVDMLTENSGLPFTMLEEGRVFAKMLEEGMTDNEIAEKVHKSIVHVRNAISLTDTPLSLQEKIEKGNVAPSTVVEMQKKMDVKEIDKNIDEALKKTGKKKVTGKDIKGAPAGRSRSSSSPKTVDGDDLTKVKGVGEKVAVALKEAGIDTFEKMAKTHPDTFKAVLEANGMSKFRNPAKWPALAHELSGSKGAFVAPEKPKAVEDAPKVEKTPPAKPSAGAPAIVDIDDVLKRLDKSQKSADWKVYTNARQTLSLVSSYAKGEVDWKAVEDFFFGA